ncbi:unnamed protein product (macronuclear) [Paramecium tetraurelia]|uniref:Uncharacterized protein n=1 Tax=Paramecium tetraurelia TaxID=5888 RepID=A0C376_PARTE|nr:uncharacterized protein GSPATT00034721001 [Paramecium tetraurelia]CAK65243.1 unnamed protein product [Paramecium tetraurelia]|eukprot:XP_001432640.1 hypothetical protein (macronuclear) [Paramecium tetraurelia strain d4-2]
MGTCQIQAQNQDKQNDQSDIAPSSHKYIVQLKLTPLVCNIMGDNDKMEDLYFDIEKQISINQEKVQVDNQCSQLLLSSKIQITHDPSSQSLDQSQQFPKSPRKNKNLNAKFKEMIF